MSRVLSTEQAKSAIQQIQSIVNGGFTDQISQLDAQGRILSDPNVWDGPLAAQFRGSTWPETKAALDKAKQELEELRTQLNSISQNIFSAGGGSLASPPPPRDAPRENRAPPPRHEWPPGGSFCSGAADRDP